MTDHLDGEETNVEGIACLIASQFPLEDAPACHEILKLLSPMVELLLRHRDYRQTGQS